jgi:hypothetical protein
MRPCSSCDICQIMLVYEKRGRKPTRSMSQHLASFPIAAQMEVKSATVVGTVGAAKERISNLSQRTNHRSKLGIMTYGLCSRDRQHRGYQRRSSWECQ